MGMHKHVFEGYLTEAGALKKSRERQDDFRITKNTVVENPSEWLLCESYGQERIVSAEKVKTFHCSRSNGNSSDWHVTGRGYCYAIFLPNGHLEANEGYSTCDSEP